MPGSDINEFYKLLETRKDCIDDQLLDMLLSYTDFQIFKEMVLDYKRRKSMGGNNMAFTIENVKP